MNFPINFKWLFPVCMALSLSIAIGGVINTSEQIIRGAEHGAQQDTENEHILEQNLAFEHDIRRKLFELEKLQRALEQRSSNALHDLEEQSHELEMKRHELEMHSDLERQKEESMEHHNHEEHRHVHELDSERQRHILERDYAFKHNIDRDNHHVWDDNLHEHVIPTKHNDHPSYDSSPNVKVGSDYKPDLHKKLPETKPQLDEQKRVNATTKDLTQPPITLESKASVTESDDIASKIDIKREAIFLEPDFHSVQYGFHPINEIPPFGSKLRKSNSDSSFRSGRGTARMEFNSKGRSGRTSSTSQVQDSVSSEGTSVQSDFIQVFEPQGR